MFDEPGFTVFLTVLAASVFKHLALGALTSQFYIQRRKREKAGILSKISIYPLKSLGGIEVESAECEVTGLVSDVNGVMLKDRSWLVITEGGTFVTARQRPKLCLIVPTVHGKWLHLDAPDMETMKLPISLSCNDGKVVPTKVWGDYVEGVDCGDEVAKWLTDYLKCDPVRLIYHAEGTANRLVQNYPSRWNSTARHVDQVAFQDAYPFMMMTDSSFADLNKKLVTSQVTSKQFRPNFVVSTDFPAFSEDDWLEIFIGDTVFHNIKPCERCMMTTLDPETGVMDANKEPLKTLRSYRLIDSEFGQSPCMGINLVAIRPGTVRVGDEVFITRRLD